MKLKIISQKKKNHAVDAAANAASVAQDFFLNLKIFSVVKRNLNY